MTSSTAQKAIRAGRLAERATIWILWLRGWSLVADRIKIGRFEMDIIMTRGPELRLLEVKFRRPGAWTAADTALSAHQRRRLQMALQHYLNAVPWPGRTSFQRVSWAGWMCKFHNPERWDILKIAE